MADHPAPPVPALVTRLGSTTGTPQNIELPARLGQAGRRGLVAAVAAALLGAVGHAFRDGPVWAVAFVVLVVTGIVWVVRGNGPLRLSPYGMSVRTYGVRRSYAWRDVAAVAPMTFRHHETTAVELVGARRTRVILAGYGRDATDLCELLTAYRDRALSARAATDRLATAGRTPGRLRSSSAGPPPGALSS